MASPLARVNVRADIWETLWSFAHRILAVNLLLALAGAPLILALSLVAEPWRYPVFFGLLALPLAPAVSAAFGYYADDDPRPPLGVLLRLMRSRARRSLLIAVVAAGLSGVLAADIKMLAKSFPPAVPLLVVLLLLVAITTLNTLAQLNPRLAVYCGVRGWGFSLLSLGVLGAVGIIVSQAPLLGLATLPGCALWVVHTNTQAQLTRHHEENSMKLFRPLRALAVLGAALAVLSPAAVAAPAAAAYDSFRPGAEWRDANGQVIQAHGGQVVPAKDHRGRQIWYWYGEDRSKGYYDSPGVHVYSSYDLYNWTDQGLALRAMSSPDQFENDKYFSKLYKKYTPAQKDVVWRDLSTNSVRTDGWAKPSILERPKVIYNKATRKWIMWVHSDGPNLTDQYVDLRASRSRCRDRGLADRSLPLDRLVPAEPGADRLGALVRYGVLVRPGRRDGAGHEPVRGRRRQGVHHLLVRGEPDDVHLEAQPRLHLPVREAGERRTG